MNLGYALIDSGEGKRLERFGDKILSRPSSLAIWKRRHPEQWAKADADYDHDAGWSFSKAPFEEWEIAVSGLTLILRAQRNGQIGFFPEHTLYLESIEQAVKAAKARTGSTPSVLNLFAFTGMASVAAVKAGATVAHIDMLKPALDWARKNAERNGLPPESLRLIPEEALVYLEREVKRGKKHDIIVLDPPSFSRLSKNKTWDLSDVLTQIVSSLAALIAPGGEIFFTSHGTEHGATTVENLLSDAIPEISVESRQLLIPELDSPRKLPAGYLVHATQ